MNKDHRICKKFEGFSQINSRNYDYFNQENSGILDKKLSKRVFKWYLSCVSSGPEFPAIWLWDMLASGWGSLWESFSFVPWLVPYAFRDVSGMVREWPWICGFMRKSSRRDNASKKRSSVLLNSCDNFFVTLPSISSEKEWFSLLVIREHLSFVPCYSWDAPHNFPCWALRVFPYSSELPFSTGKVMIND